MVKIAIAGGSGNLGQEVIDGLVATGKHEILLLSRKDTPSDAPPPGITWVKADYNDSTKLAEALQGVDTVLSFILAHQDENAAAQKSLIDASVAAGVRRFAPSEWFTASFEHMGWFGNKLTIREYLKELNKDKKVLEYSLFQPGFFLNYFAFPHQTTKHIEPIEMFVSFEKRRALLLEGSEDALVNITTIEDIVHVVVSAVDYKGEWPLVGGISGSQVTVPQLIALGEKIRGPFTIYKQQAENLKAGVIKGDWKIRIGHPSIDPAEAEAFGAMANSSMLLSVQAGSFKGSDEWNQLLPDYKFTRAEEFLAEAWKDKP